MATNNSFSAAAFTPSRTVTPCRPLPLIGEDDIEMGLVNGHGRLRTQPTARSRSFARKCGLGGRTAPFVDICVYSVISLALFSGLGFVVWALNLYAMSQPIHH